MQLPHPWRITVNSLEQIVITDYDKITEILVTQDPIFCCLLTVTLLRTKNPYHLHFSLYLEQK